MKGAEEVFEELMPDKFLNLMKNMYSHIQETQ